MTETLVMTVTGCGFCDDGKPIFVGFGPQRQGISVIMSVADYMASLFKAPEMHALALQIGEFAEGINTDNLVLNFSVGPRDSNHLITASAFERAAPAGP